MESSYLKPLSLWILYLSIGRKENPTQERKKEMMQASMRVAFEDLGWSAHTAKANGG